MMIRLLYLLCRKSWKKNHRKEKFKSYEDWLKKDFNDMMKCPNLWEKEYEYRFIIDILRERRTRNFK